MDCLDPSAASEFVEGVLDEAEASRIEAHLADCSTCRQLLAAIAHSSESEVAYNPRPPKIASSASFLSPGETIGRFVIGDVLGRGGHGVVYEARDPELDRAVAIKLLRFEYSAERSLNAEERLVREARAMARLSHPNVVTVYEVGSDQGFVFIAMELLGGETLDAWLDSEARSPGDIARAFVGAGRGLAAAHSAGLVHRDFKPANVVVTDSGKAVVLDFGLVGDGDRIAHEGVMAPSEGSASTGSLTQTGALLGTPAYMAPEQHLGEQADGAADQFAFAVCLYEALSGAHPFAARDFPTLQKRVLAGRTKPLPKRVPRRLRHAVMRGLRSAKSERYATMNEMVDAIEPTGSKQWLWAALPALGLVVAGGVYFATQNESKVCGGADETVARLWNSATTTQIRSSFSAVGLPFGPAAADKAITSLGGHVEKWKRLSTQTCRASRVTKELSEASMEQSLECFEDRWREVEALTALLSNADRSVVAEAERAVAELTDLESCQDRRRLSSIATEETTTAEAEAAAQVRTSAAQVKALVDVGNIKEALAKARAMQEPTRKLGLASITTLSSYWLGRALEAAGFYSEADSALRESAYGAIASGDDRQAVLSTTALVRVLGFRKAEFERGQEWYRIARASLQRGGGSASLERGLDLARSRLLASAGKFEKAREVATALLENGDSIEDQTPNELGRAEIHSALGSFCIDDYDYDCGEKHFRVALELLTTHLGEAHPTVASAYSSLGQASARQGKFDDALEHHRKAISLLEAGLGPDHPELGRAFHNSSFPLIATGKLDDAIDACKRALAITGASLGADNLRNAGTHYHLGYAYWSQKKFELAYENHQRALEIRAAAFGPEHAYVGDIHVELGRTRRDQKRFADAASHYEKALVIRRKKFGSDADRTIYSVTDLAAAYVHIGAARRALPLLEEAELHWSDGKKGEASMQAMNKFYLAQSLWETGGSKSRARALARAALQGYKAIKDPEAQARASQWLASH